VADVRRTVRRLDVVTAKRHNVNMSMESRKATVYLDAELHRALRLKAAESERTMSDLVNEALRQSLLEDAEDLAAFEERTEEPSMSFEDMVKDLRKRGKL